MHPRANKFQQRSLLNYQETWCPRNSAPPLEWDRHQTTLTLTFLRTFVARCLLQSYCTRGLPYPKQSARRLTGSRLLPGVTPSINNAPDILSEMNSDVKLCPLDAPCKSNAVFVFVYFKHVTANPRITSGTHVNDAQQ